MALQPFANYRGGYLYLSGRNHANFTGVGTINAAGESVAIIGAITILGGAGTSKTISSSGGKIHWAVDARTFSNAGTNLRIGIQDVNMTTGIEDTTYDVYADLVGGTDTITANSVMSTAMESGTKTISHGDIIAVVIEMTSRGGTDSISPENMAVSHFPYGTVDTGAGPAKSGSAPCITIEFDDGTLGYIETYAHQSISTTYNSGSTPDETGLLFRLPFKAVLSGALFLSESIATTDDFDVVLYSDPLGTPVVEETVSFDASLFRNASASDTAVTFSDHILDANTDYLIAIKPTTANSMGYYLYDFGSGTEYLRGVTALGTNWCYASRTDGTGAFSTITRYIPQIALALSQFDDGAGSGASNPPHIIGR